MILLSILFYGCQSDEKNPNNRDGLSVLGFADDTDEVSWTLIGDSSDGLDVPRDLAFNPENDGELWVVNRTDDSTSIFFNAGQADQSSSHIIDPYALHFMDQVSSIEFGAPGTFGTCQESRNTYNGPGMGDDFMGPTLWPSDLDVYGQTNPEAVEYLSRLFGTHVDLGSHLDMLHQTPLCMGIAWQGENVYWAFNGRDGSIDRNNFHEDHGPGYDDHSDGTIFRYGIGEFLRVENVPSHMKYHHDTAWLFIADTGHNAIKVLDTTTGESDENLPKAEPGTVHMTMTGEEYWTLIEGEEFGMTTPSGLTIVDDIIFVTDNDNSTIYAFSLDGELIDTLETPFGSGALMGIYAASVDDLWLVNAIDNEVWRLQPKNADANSIPFTDEYTSF